MCDKARWDDEISLQYQGSLKTPAIRDMVQGRRTAAAGDDVGWHDGEAERTVPWPEL